MHFDRKLLKSQVYFLLSILVQYFQYILLQRFYSELLLYYALLLPQ